MRTRAGRTVIQGRTFYSDVIVNSPCVEVGDCAFVECGLYVVAPVEHCVIARNTVYGGGRTEGSIVVTCGSPNQRRDTNPKAWKRHAYELGTNCVGYVGNLAEKRKPALVTGEIALLNLEGLTDAWPGHQRKVIFWNEATRYETIWHPPMPDSQAYIHAGTNVLNVPNLPDGEYQWCALTPDYWVIGPTIEENVVYGGRGSGISVYGSVGAEIRGNRVFDCVDYGIGVEFSTAASIEGNLCAGNQFSHEACRPWNQFEAVGHCALLATKDNDGQFGMVPKGYFQDGATINA